MKENFNESALHILFEESLYILDETTSVKKEEVSTPKITNKLQDQDELKNVILIASKPFGKYLPFINKIMGAVNLTSDQYSTVDQQDFNIGSITSKKIISFGTSAVNIGIQDTIFSLYELKEKEGNSYLFVDEVAKIADDTAKKQALWMSLKRMFNL